MMPGSVDEFSNAMLGIPEFRARGGILRGLFYLGRTLRQLVRRKTRGCVVPLQGTWAHLWYTTPDMSGCPTWRKSATVFQLCTIAA